MQHCLASESDRAVELVRVEICWCLASVWNFPRFAIPILIFFCFLFRCRARSLYLPNNVDLIRERGHQTVHGERKSWRNHFFSSIFCNNLHSLNPTHSITVTPVTHAHEPNRKQITFSATSHLRLHLSERRAAMPCVSRSTSISHLSFSPLTRQCWRGCRFISSNIISHSYSWSRQNRIVATQSRDKPPTNHSNSEK